MNKAKEAETKEEAKMQKLAKWTLGTGALLIFIAPGIITHCTSCISFSDTGEIGDTIGGITAPIVNFMGALLVYYALKAQIRANKLVQDQFEYQKMSTYILEQIAILKEDIKDFTFEYESMQHGTIITYSGKEAFSKVFCSVIDWDYNCEYSSNNAIAIKSIYYFMDRLKLLLLKVQGSSLENNDKRQFLEILIHANEVNFESVWELHRDKLCDIYEKPCKDCGKLHLIQIGAIYRLYDEINVMGDFLKQ